MFVFKFIVIKKLIDVNNLMLTKSDYLIAKELKSRLSKEVNLIDFKVFGSRARGVAGKYSDMDIFLEVDFVNREIKKKIREITWEVGFENSIVISSLIFSRHELEKTPLRSSPIVKNIKEEGVRL